MLALRIRLLTGRYHATPWGRNANEADVAWPPEPWRLLRAMIAAYWRKGDRKRWPESALARLIDALAEIPPAYALPSGAIHTHTRHYMPQGRGRTTLVFDAFLRLPKDAEVVAIWDRLTLDEDLFALAADLASAIGYLGRAESWTECEALDDWKGEANCGPQEAGYAGDAVRLLAPLSATAYATARGRLIRDEHQRVSSSATKAQSERACDAAVAKAFRSKRSGLDTLPVRLLDAVSLDTADWQDTGWSRPPAAQEVLYARSEHVGASVAPAVKVRRAISGADRPLPTVGRFILAGRPRPRVEDTVKIAEVMRLAALSKFGWNVDPATARRKSNAPAEISGRSKDGKPLRHPSHSHAFWLPEDADSDGRIDHVTVFIAGGMSLDVRDKLDRITRVWLGSRGRVEDGAGDASADEWRLALEGFGSRREFAATAGILGSSTRWRSVTPFMAAGHLKSPGYTGYGRELRRLLAKTGVDKRFGFDVNEVKVSGLGEIRVGGTLRRTLHFHRFRSRGGGKQPDTGGAFLEVVFPVPVHGPVALGFGSHFGLGLFAPEVMGAA